MKPMRRSPLLIIALFLVLIGAGLWYMQTQQSSSTMSITLLYTDGTTRVIESSPTDMQTLTITDGSGKQVDGISWTVKVTPVYTGTATATSVQGNIVELVDDVQKKTTAITTYNTKILSGSTAQVHTGSVAASTIQAYNAASGSHTYKIRADLTLSVSYDSSPTATKTASITGSISYAVTNYSITTFSILVSPAYFGGL